MADLEHTFQTAGRTFDYLIMAWFPAELIDVSATFMIWKIVHFTLWHLTDECVRKNSWQTIVKSFHINRFLERNRLVVICMSHMMRFLQLSSVFDQSKNIVRPVSWRNFKGSFQWHPTGYQGGKIVWALGRRKC